MKKEKKRVTLQPDNRKEFYSEFEDFLLMNGDLIILLAIIGILLILVFIILLNASLFQSPYVLLR